MKMGIWVLDGFTAEFLRRFSVGAGGGRRGFLLLEIVVRSLRVLNRAELGSGGRPYAQYYQIGGRPPLIPMYPMR